MQFQVKLWLRIETNVQNCIEKSSFQTFQPIGWRLVGVNFPLSFHKELSEMFRYKKKSHGMWISFQKEYLQGIE